MAMWKLSSSPEVICHCSETLRTLHDVIMPQFHVVTFTSFTSLCFRLRGNIASIILCRVCMSSSCLPERSAPWRQIFSRHFFPTGITEWANRRVGRINRLFCQYWRALAYGHVVTLTHRVNLSMLCWLWPRHWNSNSMLFYEMKARLNVWNSISGLVTLQSPATYAS